RFDGDDHAFLKARTAPGFPIIRQVRFVVHPGANAVPDEFAHHRKTVLLDQTLHRVANVAQAVAGAHLVDRAIERVAGYVQQLLQLRPDLADWNRHRRIREISVHFHAEVDRDDVAFLQLPLRRRNSVHDLAVHRRAEHARITAIAFEGRVPRFTGDVFLGDLLEVHRRHTRTHAGTQLVQHF